MVRDRIEQPTESPHRSRPSVVSEFQIEIKKRLQSYERIDLNGLKSHALMKRLDTKCWFRATRLIPILEAIAPHYRLLEIGDNGVQTYQTTYYDTSEDTYYLDHHNQRAQRTKVRKREYVGSKLSFLEVKHKTNKGVTNKRRISIPTCSENFPETERSFLGDTICEAPEHLEAVIHNRFKRITLVHKHLPERCTIDIDLSFHHGAHHTALNQLAIIELKHGHRGIRSDLVNVLKSLHIPFRGFSKYCYGRALMDPGLKQNRLKASLLKIQKYSHK